MEELGLFKDEARRTDKNLTCVTSLLRKQEACLTRSYLGTFSPTRNSVLAYLVGFGLSEVKSSMGGSVLERDKLLDPWGLPQFHAFCFLPKTCLLHQIQNQKIQGHTEHSSQAGRGRVNEGDASSSTPPPPHPREPKILHSYPGMFWKSS